MTSITGHTEEKLFYP